MIVHDQQQKRLNRIRNKIKTNLGVPRLSVYRSNTHIWAQVIDDKHGKTIVSSSTKSLKLVKGTKSEKAAELGKTVAKLALEKKIVKVRFDRGLYRYHGRVKALAEAARSGGLDF